MKPFYESILHFIRKHHIEKPIILISKISPYITAIMYVVVLALLLINKSPYLFITIIKPMSAFLLVTLIRKVVDMPRPCVTMGIEPLIKHKLGESFPSRHTVSAFSIALSFYIINKELFLIAFIIACIVAITRIICGLHHIKDVVVAIIISLIIHCI